MVYKNTRKWFTRINTEELKNLYFNGNKGGFETNEGIKKVLVTCNDQIENHPATGQAVALKSKDNGFRILLVKSTSQTSRGFQLSWV